jgi:hypothetical protein
MRLHKNDAKYRNGHSMKTVDEIAGSGNSSELLASQQNNYNSPPVGSHLSQKKMTRLNFDQSAQDIATLPALARPSYLCVSRLYWPINSFTDRFCFLRIYVLSNPSTGLQSTLRMVWLSA